jgi:hypothetical protein
VVAGMGAALTGTAPSAVLVGAGFFLWSFSVPIVNGCYNSIVQVKVPVHLQGRVFAFNQMLALASMPIGFLLAGPLASIVGPLLATDGSLATSLGRVMGTGPDRGLGLAFLGVGGLLVAATVGARLHPPIWLIDERVPDAPEAGATTSGERAVDAAPAHVLADSTH